MKSKLNNRGISLITLIITIIVIIILAAIVIFTGLRTPDRANLAKFVSEFSDFHTAVTQDYMHKKAEYAVQRISRSDAQIYYIIANNGDSSIIENIDNEPTKENGYANVFTLADLGLQDKNLDLKGENFYLIENDTYVDGWKQNKKYFDATEKHYISDKGEVIITPGYMVDDGNTTKWYVAENKYYESDSPIRGPKTIVVNGYKVVDSSGNEKTAKSVEYNSSNKLYIEIDAIVDGGNITYKVGDDTTEYAINQKYEVNKNGKFEFTLKASVEGVNDLLYTVMVNQFDIPTLADKLAEPDVTKRLAIGDYIYYDPDPSNTYTTTVEYAGAKNNLSPSTGTNKKWRVWDISGEKIIIVPNDSYTNGTLYLNDVQGYVNGAKIVNDACKALFTNSTLGVTSGDIRSMTIEDINAVYGSDDGVPMYSDLKYLFWLTKSATPSSEKVSAGYTAKSHSTDTMNSSNTGYRKFFFPNDINGNTISGFGDMEGKLAGTTDGMKYLAISSGNPVYIKNTNRSSNSASWNVIGGTGRNSTANYGSMLPFYSWLASPSVALNSSEHNAMFGIQAAGWQSVVCWFLYRSNGVMHRCDNALRPLVSLSFLLPVYSGTGTSSSPYKLQ